MDEKDTLRTAVSSRRKFLIRSLALGCSAAASPLVTPVSFASAPSDNRLVVIILRGAMDGLDVVRPVDDPLLKQYRPAMNTADQIALTGGFALHPALSALSPMWRAGELAFGHAVSTPYRDKRSHFDGQDLLEAGYSSLDGFRTSGRSGWLNRMLTLLPGASARTAFSVGHEDLILLEGPAPVSSWAPGLNVALSDQEAKLLQMVYEEDPLFHAAATEAIALSAAFSAADMNPDGDDPTSMADTMRAAAAGRGAQALAEFTADQLNGGSRIAAFSLGGFDTHHGQNAGLSRSLRDVSAALTTLRDRLGDNWRRTTVLCVTEFGRTVRENGTRGTDHGTGGAMIMAGGAVRGGKIYGRWPGLAEADLYQGRDLLPTMDVRTFAAHAMQDLFGFKSGDLENTVFPGLDMSNGQRFIL